MALTIQGFINSTAGKSIFIPGYKTAECVAPFWLFNSQHKGERYAAAGACNLYTTANGQPYIWDTYDRIPAGGPFRDGDWLIWAGNHGAYPNGGSGHVAMRYGSGAPAGWVDTYSQNPGPFTPRRLSTAGIIGALRARGVPAGAAAAGGLVNRTVTQNVAWVRTAPNSGAALAPGLPSGLSRGAVLAVKGYVAGQDPFNTGDNAWYVTKSGFYVWANAAGNSLAGLVKL